jgi:hypothetical protein
MGDMRNAHNIMVGKPEGKKPFERPKRTREDKIRVYDVDWIHLDQNRDKWRALLNTIMNLRNP